MHYERRCPEQTALYSGVQEHVETFFAHAQEATGADVPEFVKAEVGHEQSGGLFVPVEEPGLRLRRGLRVLKHASAAYRHNALGYGSALPAMPCQQCRVGQQQKEKSLALVGSHYRAGRIDLNERGRTCLQLRVHNKNLRHERSQFLDRSRQPIQILVQTGGQLRWLRHMLLGSEGAPSSR